MSLSHVSHLFNDLARAVFKGRGAGVCLKQDLQCVSNRSLAPEWQLRLRAQRPGVIKGECEHGFPSESSGRPAACSEPSRHLTKSPVPHKIPHQWGSDRGAEWRFG